MRLTWYFYLSCQVCSWRSNLWMWFCRHWLTDESFGSWPHFKIHGIWKLSSMMWYNIGTFWQGDVVVDRLYSWICCFRHTKFFKKLLKFWWNLQWLPPSIGKEKCMHMQQCSGLCTGKQTPSSLTKIMTAVSIPKYIKCNRKTLQQSPAVKYCWFQLSLNTKAVHSKHFIDFHKWIR